MDRKFFEEPGAARTLATLIAVLVVLKVVAMWIVLPIASRNGIVPANVSMATDLYSNIAHNLVAGNGYRVTPESAETMMRGPGYVLFLAGIYQFFGESINVVKVANLILGLGTVCIVFFLALRLTSNTMVAAAAGAITALHPSILVMETRVSVESLFIFLLTLFVFLLDRALRLGTHKSLFLAGLSLGVVVLTRSSPIFVVPLMFFYLVFRSANSLTLSAAFKKVGVLLLGAIIVLAPWMARNYALAGTPTFSENLVGIGAFQGLYVTKTMDEDKGYQARIFEARRLQSDIAAKKGVNLAEFDGDPFWDVFPTIRDEQAYNKVLLQTTLDEYKNNPSLFVRHCFYNSIRFWFQGATPKITMLGVFVTLPLLILAAAGAYKGVRNGVQVAPLLLIISAIYCVHIPLISHARYSTPLVPLLAVLTAIALDAAFRRRWHMAINGDDIVAPKSANIQNALT